MAYAAYFLALSDEDQTFLDMYRHVNMLKCFLLDTLRLS